MEQFGEVTRRWFGEAFESATEVQRRGWETISRGEHTLLIAPTGSGKTLAAFLWAIDRLAHDPDPGDPGVRVVYVSPLKALVYDIERNLRVPLRGIERTAARLGVEIRIPLVDVRTGDTPSKDRQRQIRNPAEILVTTPESLFLMLGSQARETFRGVRWIIVDEIHAMADTKRGAHLALSLERLSRLADEDPQRIGLSATARPTEEVARFLGGDRPVRVIDTHRPPRLDLEVIVPVEDMTRPTIPTSDGGRATVLAESGGRPGVALLAAEEETTRQFGIWPAVYPRLLELIQQHQTTIVFVNSRGLCERLAQRLNELAGEELVRAHHGSLAHHQRREIEEALKAGALRGIVATSSLELGIDMGAVDLVILVESPGSVARGLQRVGRAGHAVGEVSIGRVFPKHRGDLLEAAVVSRRMREGAIEPLRIPRNPLDVLAQHIVAMVSVQPWKVSELAALVRRAANFRDLPDSALTSVLDMLSGLYPSHDFSDLRPRIHWDRERDVLEGRKGSRMLAALNAGTIPDRGLYAVHLGPDGPRVGELDEEMVHESQAGQTFALGATTWRILEITRDRVVVEPAPGEPGRLPFWKGEGPGRPLELGRALGAFTREIASLDRDEALARLQSEYGLDPLAARNLVDYLEEQQAATGALPSDRTIVIERFRDELGDWKVCVLTPFGARVHAPWALALRAAVSARVGYDVQTLWSDDGIVLTIADGDEPPGLDILVPDSEEVEERVIEQLPRSPLFAAQFRENAARSLLLPRRQPGARTPLFAQRLRAQKLMEIALQYPSFPVVMETFRACLQDVFDVPALVEILRAVERREIKVHEAETPVASPFSRSLVFAYVAAHMYEGDSPAAERRAQALSLDMRVLRELLGEADLRQLLDEGTIAEVEAELQRTAPGRRARDAEELHDVLRQLGHLTLEEVRERTAPVSGSTAGAGTVAGAAGSEPSAAAGATNEALAETVNPEVDAEIAAGAGTAADVAASADPQEHASRADALLRELERTRRAVPIRVQGQKAWIAVEDAGLYRDALGTALPAGVPSVFLAPVEQPVEVLLLRYARTHGPFTTEDVSLRFGLVPAQAEILLRDSANQGRLLEGAFRPGGVHHEWCDPDVLRQIKRRTIAKLRGQVAPVTRDVLGRFLPAWHGVIGGSSLTLEEAIEQLEGIPLSYRELERYILPARVRGFRPQQLDELGARGWLVWVGHSPIGPNDGRIVLYRRERVHRLLQPVGVEETTLELADTHRAILKHLEQRGASFLPELLMSTAEATSAELIEALWDLVWAGLVTNDTFAALRSLAGRSRVRPVTPTRRGDGWMGRDRDLGRGSRRMRPRIVSSAGVGGRWSLVKNLVFTEVTPTERAHAWAATLLNRHGLVTRETAAVEGLRGGFAGVYQVLRSMEEAGRIRRGYFVEGLGGAQFAYPGVVERLRRVRDEEAEPEVVVLSATDPANPYGWLLPWPEYQDPTAQPPRRSVGAAVVLVDGAPVLYLDQGGKRLRTLAGAEPESLLRALNALRTLAHRRPRNTLTVEKVDGHPAAASPLTRLLQEVGFVREYQSMRLYVRSLTDGEE